MTQQQITIHAALGELKKLDARINKLNRDNIYIGSKKLSSAKVNGTNSEPGEFSITAKSNYDSVIDLIARRDAIKSMIVLSNATTKLSVGKVEMTVAEAIERKSSIDYKIDLLNNMRRQYKEVISTTNLYNEKVEINLDAQITNLSGKDSNKDNLSGYMTEYRKQNGWNVVDPLDLNKVIQTLEEEITDFMSNVDVALSISNATNFITI